ncbi:hypothetical protein PS898_02803 [Pseudomonas fluorescens]|nr:hypothetical protein PS898_02803 [Pseudomonas fluorescens]
MRQSPHWAGFVVELVGRGDLNSLSKLLIYIINVGYFFSWNTNWNTTQMSFNLTIPFASEWSNTRYNYDWVGCPYRAGGDRQKSADSSKGPLR